MTAAIECALQMGAAAMADRKAGQVSLFGMFDEEPQAKAEAQKVVLPEVAAWSDREKLLNEKEVLGFYLESHPMAEFDRSWLPFAHTPPTCWPKPKIERSTGRCADRLDQVCSYQKRKPGMPTKYANFDLEDMQGVVRCILWPSRLPSMAKR